MAVRIHHTADVSKDAKVGDNTMVWHGVQIRAGAILGANCIISKGVYIDFDVEIGANVKIQNYVSVYHGVTIEDGVFVGPYVCFTNDLRPRAVNPDGSLKAGDDWELAKTRVCRGASLGANATIRSGIQIGAWAMIGAGSVVTRNVPDYGLVIGNPARLVGFVCPCGGKLAKKSLASSKVLAGCQDCETVIEIPVGTWEQIR